MRRLILLALIACSRKDEPAPSPNSPPAAAASEVAPAPADVVWDVPSTWTTVPNTSAMRKATYAIPRGEGETSDTLCIVSKAGGGVDANIERWKGQFRSPSFKRSAMTPHGVKVTLVELRGDYNDTMAPSGTPKPNQEMLAAIIETQPELTFFKLLGSERSVEAAKGDFLRLVESVRSK